MTFSFLYLNFRLEFPQLMNGKYLSKGSRHDHFLVIDIRNSNLFALGNIPGSYSFPFDYKESIRRRHAFTPEMHAYIDEILAKASQYSFKKILVVCKDGGFPSKWVWDKLHIHIDTYIYKNGYRAYRKTVRAALNTRTPLYVLYGNTGSGKSAMLKSAEKNGLQVLNLAKMANHSGSVFGNLISKNQPSQEQYENIVYERLSQLDASLPTLTEYEPIHLGMVHIPESIYENMKNGIPIYIEVSKQKRIARLVQEYAAIDDEKLQAGIDFLKPRIGDQNHVLLTSFMAEKAYTKVANILIDYFDETPGYTNLLVHKNDWIIKTDELHLALEEVIQIMAQKKTSPEEDATVKPDV